MSDPLAALRARFLTRCAVDRVRLSAIVAGGDLEAIELRTMAHNLAGAAGTFGFAAISRAAVTIDDRIHAGLPVHAADVQTLIDALGQAIGAASTHNDRG